MTWTRIGSNIRYRTTSSHVPIQKSENNIRSSSDLSHSGHPWSHDIVHMVPFIYDSPYKTENIHLHPMVP